MGLKQQLKRPELQPIGDGKGGWVATPALSGFLNTAPRRSIRAWADRHPEAWVFLQRVGLDRMETVVRLGQQGLTDDELRAANVSEDEIRKLRNTPPEDLTKLVDVTIPALRRDPWLTWLEDGS